jgi:capsular exopolysaccharide synthesis family protein
MTPHDDGPQLELRDYLHVLRRRRVLVALGVIVVVGGALVASLLQTPVYRASATVLLQPSANETLFNPNTGQATSPNDVATAIQVVGSRPVQDQVRQQLGVAPAVSAGPIGQTDVIAISADSTIPAQAVSVANAYANGFIDVRRTQAVDDLLAAAAQIQGKVADLQKQIDALDLQVSNAPLALRDSVQATVAPERDALLTEQSAFKQKLNETQVDSALQNGGAQLVSPAVAAGSPIKPRTRRSLVIAVIVGLMFGIGLAFLFEHLDDSIKSKDDLDRAVRGVVPTIGLIPTVPGWKHREEPRVVSFTDPSSATAEAYRTLRTSLTFLALDKPVRVLQVTSPSASEGKTTTLANLGVSMASAGKRVVISCADLRRPRVHEFFGLTNDVGLTSVVLGDVPLHEALQSIPEIPGLSLLASGKPPPNPSELLSSARAAEIFESLRAQFDLVLLDSPPVLPVTDAAVLSRCADALVLVATAGTTTRREASRAVELLRQVDAPLVGTVLNGVSGEGGYGYEYGYYGYSRYIAADNGKSGNGARRQQVSK